MKRFIAAFLCLLIPTIAFAADNSYKVAYDGGSIADIKSGASANLVIEQIQVRLAKDKKDLVVIPASAITEISYGQDVHRRIGTAIGLAVVSLGIGALMAFSKSKKHFVGITYADGDKKGGPCSASAAFHSSSTTSDNCYCSSSEKSTVMVVATSTGVPLSRYGL